MTYSAVHKALVDEHVEVEQAETFSGQPFQNIETWWRRFNTWSPTSLANYSPDVLTWSHNSDTTINSRVPNRTQFLSFICLLFFPPIRNDWESCRSSPPDVYRRFVYFRCVAVNTSMFFDPWRRSFFDAGDRSKQSGLFSEKLTTRLGKAICWLIPRIKKIGDTLGYCSICLMSKLCTYKSDKR